MNLKEHDETPRGDQRILLDGLSFADYERLLAMRGEKSSPRIAFLEGLVEITRPALEHERLKSAIRCLVDAWCLDRDLPFTPVGSWTLKDEGEGRGVEPDECYVFGTAPAERPHLALEVIWTSGGIDKLELYRRLGVAEVWLWRRGGIHVYVLRGDRYMPLAHSEVLPGIDLELLVSCLDRPTVYHSIRDFRAALASLK